MTVDLSKLKKGDEVEFRCGGKAVVSDVKFLCCMKTSRTGRSIVFEGAQGGHRYTDDGIQWCGLGLIDIIAIHSKFDWDTVEAGMAFTDDDGDLVIYIGPDYRTNGWDVVCLHTHSEQHFGHSKLTLTRAPEHDIEVK